MTSNLFEILIRKIGHISLLGTHLHRIDRVISAVRQLLKEASISARFKVEIRLDAEGSEWLRFSLKASPQLDMYRLEQAGNEQVDLEASDIRAAVLSKVIALREMIDEVRLTPSKFWEILHRSGIDTTDLDVIRVARTLQVKRLQMADAGGDQQSLLCDDLLGGMARAKPVDMSIAVKLVSANHAICKVVSILQPIETPPKTKVRLVWGSFEGVEAISNRLLAANQGRHPLKVKAHPVIGINGEIHSFEFVEFLTAA